MVAEINRSIGTVVVCNAMSGSVSQVSSRKFSGNEKDPRLRYPGYYVRSDSKNAGEFSIEGCVVG